jgi:hypothetical protein
MATDIIKATKFIIKTLQNNYDSNLKANEEWHENNAPELEELEELRMAV